MLDIASVTIARALDGVFAQQVLSAHNIANANTPGFAPLRLSFAQQLQELSASSESSMGGIGENGRARIQSSPWQVVSEPAGSMRLDLETVGFQRSAGHYTALLSILEKQLQVQSLALSDGRGR